MFRVECVRCVIRRVCVVFVFGFQCAALLRVISANEKESFTSSDIVLIALCSKEGKDTDNGSNM